MLVILPTEASSLFSQTAIRYAFEWLGVAFGLFGVGWLGTQRIWFQRLLAGRGLSPSEVWQLSWRYLGRFLALGVIVGIPVFAAQIWIVVPLGINRASLPAHIPGWWLPFVLAYSFLVDITLTFVTPALAYTTAKVTIAIKIGLDMVRQLWPDSAPYSIAPAVALLALAAFAPTSAWLRIVLVVISTLIGLILKGAIAAFYLRANRDRGGDIPTGRGPSPPLVLPQEV